MENLETTTVKSLRNSLLRYVDYIVRANTSNNDNYFQKADEVWDNEIDPFVRYKNITSWERDIKNRFIDDSNVRFNMSKKQADCLASAFQKLNPETIK